jgi:hypothetical protein
MLIASPISHPVAERDVIHRLRRLDENSKPRKSSSAVKKPPRSYVMLQTKTTIIAVITLVIGFAGGFALRPVIAPTQQAAVVRPSPIALAASEARGTQYFVAHIDEARRVVDGCRDGSVRGGECATAEEAIIKVDAAERTKRFLGN